MTGTREYILFTRGPPVNDLFPGDPQLRYGDPGVPFHPKSGAFAPMLCSQHSRGFVAAPECFAKGRQPEYAVAGWRGGGSCDVVRRIRGGLEVDRTRAFLLCLRALGQRIASLLAEGLPPRDTERARDKRERYRWPLRV